MSVRTVAAGRSSLGTARGWLRDRPVVPLILLLGVLVVALQVVRPGIVSADFASSTMRFAIPLAILAACQTLTMLTGGVDLSVAVVASMTSYVMVTNVSDVGWFGAVLIGLAPAAVVGLVNGIGIGLFRVHPLIMTLSTSLIVSGLVNVYARANMPAARASRPRSRTSAAAACSGSCRTASSSSSPWRSSSCSRSLDPASAACCSRSATTRSHRALPAFASAGCCSRSTCSRACSPAWPG